MKSYQRHSDTSREAFERLEARMGDQMAAIMRLLSENPSGLTGRQIATILEMPIGTASARLSAIVSEGHVIKTSMRYGTPAGYIHVLREHWVPLIHGQTGKKSYTTDKRYKEAIKLLECYSKGHWDGGESAVKFLQGLGVKHANNRTA